MVRCRATTTVGRHPRGRTTRRTLCAGWRAPRQRRSPDAPYRLGLPSAPDSHLHLASRIQAQAASPGPDRGRGPRGAGRSAGARLCGHRRCPGPGRAVRGADRPRRVRDLRQLSPAGPRPRLDGVGDVRVVGGSAGAGRRAPGRALHDGRGGRGRHRVDHRGAGPDRVDRRVLVQAHRHRIRARPDRAGDHRRAAQPDRHPGQRHRRAGPHPGAGFRAGRDQSADRRDRLRRVGDLDAGLQVLAEACPGRWWSSWSG